MKSIAGNIVILVCMAMIASVTLAQGRVGYATQGAQASFTHCDPLPKSGRPAFIYGGWEMNDGLLQQRDVQSPALALCNHVIDTDHYTITCRARKDGGDGSFAIVFNYVDSQNYWQVNFGSQGNSQHFLEQVIDGERIRAAAKHGTVGQTVWHDIKITVSGNSVRFWFDNTLLFDEQLSQRISKSKHQSPKEERSYKSNIK